MTYAVNGAAEVLQLVDRTVPAPGPSEVAVEIRRAGVNPTDVKARRGAEAGTPVHPPQIPGHDGAGVVVGVGAGVDEGLIGRRVWVWDAAWQRPEGTTAHTAIVPAAQVVELPDGVSYDVGASLGIPFLTAHRCLTVGVNMPDLLAPGSLAGRTVLIAGGAGLVGNASIQLATMAGATVITTVSSASKADLARAAGADHVVNYREEDVVTAVRRIAPQGVDVVVEVSPSANAWLDTQVVADNGCIVVYANDGGKDMVLPVRDLMFLNTQVQFVVTYTTPVAAKVEAVRVVSEAIATGAIRIGTEAGLPLHRFTLAQAADAHTAVESPVVGKVLIDVSDD